MEIGLSPTLAIRQVTKLWCQTRSRIQVPTRGSWSLSGWTSSNTISTSRPIFWLTFPRNCISIPGQITSSCTKYTGQGRRGFLVRGTINALFLLEPVIDRYMAPCAGRRPTSIRQRSALLRRKSILTPLATNGRHGYATFWILWGWRIEFQLNQVFCLAKDIHWATYPIDTRTFFVHLSAFLSDSVEEIFWDDGFPTSVSRIH